MSRIKAVLAREVVRPLRTTFSTSLGQKQFIHNMLVTVILDDGRKGTGEVPTSFAFKDETLPVIIGTLRAASKRMKGVSIGDYMALIRELRTRFPGARMTVSGLGTALFRAFLSTEGRDELGHWGGRQRRLETDITIPFLTDREAVNAWAGYLAKKGFTSYKLKVSGRVEEDMYVLSLLHSALRPRAGSFRLRLDGNQGYTAETFMDLVGLIEKQGYEVELFEQPLKKDDLRGLVRIRGRCPYPVILDEAVVTLADARRVIDHDLCDGVNVKLAKSGVDESKEILDYAQRCGKKVMIGCMMETVIGLSAAVFLAAGTGRFDFVDLDSIYFLYGQNRYPGISVDAPAFLIT